MHANYSHSAVVPSLHLYLSLATPVYYSPTALAAVLPVAPPPLFPLLLTVPLLFIVWLTSASGAFVGGVKLAANVL
uniref:Uncharacterized protein n=1 Tax=Arundo donax TaxID=35708 RepID=A0A0A9HTU6_ARUDO